MKIGRKYPSLLLSNWEKKIYISLLFLNPIFMVVFEYGVHASILYFSILIFIFGLHLWREIQVKYSVRGFALGLNLRVERDGVTSLRFATRRFGYLWIFEATEKTPWERENQPMIFREMEQNEELSEVLDKLVD